MDIRVALPISPVHPLLDHTTSNPCFVLHVVHNKEICVWHVSIISSREPSILCDQSRSQSKFCIVSGSAPFSLACDSEKKKQFIITRMVSRSCKRRSRWPSDWINQIKIWRRMHIHRPDDVVTRAESKEQTRVVNKVENECKQSLERTSSSQKSEKCCRSRD